MSFTPLTVSTSSDGSLLTNYGITEPSEGPWRFRRLAEPELTSELERFANAKSSVISGARVDSVWFQPAQGEENQSQDRVYAGRCSFGGQTWSLFGVFDGHAGEECADYTLKYFPDHLEAALSARMPEDMSSALSNAFTSFDNQILDGVKTIFPNPQALVSMSNEGLTSQINDQASGGVNYEKILLAMRGTTALVALLDEAHKNMWVAGAGDCRAILGVQRPDGKWEARDLIAPHNGSNPHELENVASAHPGEPEVTLKNRVLGAIAVTRAFGDAAFKLPAEYTWEVFLRANPGFRVHSSVEAFTKRNLTPPYMTASPDVVHLDLGGDGSTSDGTPRFIILTSDGSVDEHVLNIFGRSEAQSFQKWVELVGAQLDAKFGDEIGMENKTSNLALSILREAFGGSNEELVSMFLTLDMKDKWIDDTSIQVIVL
ncbi:protein phosphatase 2C [Ceratobasidium sp. AG-Ba]|nr:protein phosphatase 2C [Ceratobasidium sp. AG-Ba]QRW11013.1 protein phosphatase 2C [Ceratobasidium sp. AG-Ba]